MGRSDTDSTPASGCDPLTPLRIASGLIESLPLGLLVFDRQLRVVQRNRLSECHLPACDSVELALNGAGLESGAQDWAAELRRAIAEGRAARFECVACRIDGGDSGFLNLSISPLRDENEREVVGGLLVTEDVTARMNMEQRLAVSERMASLGTLASRVAHELNNPLDGILRYIHLALRVIHSPERERAEHYLTQCRTGLKRMVQIVGDLLEFSRSAHAHNGTGSIHSVIDDALDSFEERIQEQAVTVSRSFHDRAPGIRGDSLYQVFCNLIKNALDAMPDGGTLRVTTEVANEHVSISFADNGPGLPGNPERIFEPFYTTKLDGSGTGLGLAICREIIERYHGRIEANTGKDGGAVFRIRVPLSSCIAMDGQRRVENALTQE